MAEKRKDKPCNHAESVNFQRQDNPSYFSATYINANKSWPWLCFEYSINFGSEYNVNNKHLLWFVKMLQSMIMYVCVQCVYIVTTKCKAMRQNHLDEHDDQETIVIYIFLLFYTYSGPASIRETNDKKKHLHLVKYEQKNIL